MGFDDFTEPEVGAAVLITAAVASPTVRRTLRRGAAYGLAGVMLAGDAAGRFVRSVGNGAQQLSQRGSQAVSAATSPKAAK